MNYKAGGCIERNSSDRRDSYFCPRPARMAGRSKRLRSAMMKCNPLFVLAVLALGACSESGKGGQEIGKHAEAGEGPVMPPPGSPGGVHGRSSSQRLASPNIQAYLCGMDCRDAGLLDARSPNEAAWLFNHGYPSTQEKAHLEQLSREDLKREADSGNRAAAVELGRRVALEENVLDGKILLRKQAQAGNLYAYYGLADVSAKADPPSLVDTAAYLRMAYMLGDDRAAQEIARMNLTSAELVAADKRASHLYAGYAGEQLRDPRPQE